MTRLVRLATVVAVLAGFVAASPAMANVASATAAPAKPAPAITSVSTGLPYHQPDPNVPRIALPLSHASGSAGRVSAWAARRHLTVVGTVNGIVTVTGSRAQVTSTFGSATAPQVPAALAGVATAAASDVSPLRMRALGLHNRPMVGSTPAITWPGGYGSASCAPPTTCRAPGAG